MSTALRVPFEFDPSTHTFTQGGLKVPSVTQVLARAGLCDYSFVDAETREYSMKRGTSVHWMTQLEDQGALNYRSVPKSLRGYRKAYKLWKERSGFKPVFIEMQFVSRFGYAGIIDRFGTLPPAHYQGTIVDLKTGPVQNWTRYQLTAYSVVAAGDDPVRAQVFRRIALRLSDDGTYNVREFPMSTWKLDWAKFMQELGRMNGSNGN